MIRIVVSIACLTCIAACSDAAPPSSGAAPASGSAATPTAATTPAQDSLRDAFVVDGLALSDDALGDLIEQVTPPDSVRVETVPNRFEAGQIDTLRVLHYSGIRLRLHKAGEKQLLTEVLVTDSRYLAAPVRIGMAWSEVVGLFGSPLDSESGEPRYSCVSCDGAEEPVFFVVADGRVTGVRFTFYVD